MCAVRAGRSGVGVKEKEITPPEGLPMVSQVWSLLGAKRPRQRLGGRQHRQQLVRPRRRPFADRAARHERPRQLLDRVVVGIGDVDVARPVHRHAIRAIQPRGDQGADRLRRGVPLLDRVVAAIGDVDVARPVHRHATRVIQPRGDQGADRLRRGIPLLDRVVDAIGDVDVARPVHRHALGPFSPEETRVLTVCVVAFHSLIALLP